MAKKERNKLETFGLTLRILGLICLVISLIAIFEVSYKSMSSLFYVSVGVMSLGAILDFIGKRIKKNNNPVNKD